MTSQSDFDPMIIPTCMLILLFYIYPLVDGIFV
jgi:hypothetical protein